MAQKKWLSALLLILPAMILSLGADHYGAVKEFRSKHFSVQSKGTADLLSIYKKGVIVCDPDPEFAKDVDWESLFLDSRRQIKVAPDGTIFVSNQRDHSISRFSPDGIFQKNFGKKGKGPGDMEIPGNMSVLDERFLVISDRIPNHRINLFHLDGTFHKMLKTKKPPSFPEALSKNKIVYISSVSRPPARADSLIFRYLRKVILKDVQSGEEKEVVEYLTSMNPIKDGRSSSPEQGKDSCLSVWVLSRNWISMTFQVKRSNPLPWIFPRFG